MHQELQDIRVAPVILVQAEPREVQEYLELPDLVVLKVRMEPRVCLVMLAIRDPQDLMVHLVSLERPEPQELLEVQDRRAALAHPATKELQEDQEHQVLQVPQEHLVPRVVRVPQVR